MSETPTPTPESTPEGGKEPEKQTEQTFTQAEVDKIIGKTRTEERRKVTERFADYDDLKATAGEKASLEERVAEIERQARDSESRAMRAEVANAKGLTPNQAKRLVGATREELESDADELLADIGAQKQNGNHVPDEGKTPKPGGDNSREFVKELFGRANAE